MGVMHSPVEIVKAEPEGPVLLDSPHSGCHYPADFKHACPRALLRRTEDALVHELFMGGAVLGATLIHANFARSFVDVNRDATEIDPALVDYPIETPSDKARLGVGLVWRHVNGVQIYDRRLSATEVEFRIRGYWLPYRQALDAAWSRIAARHGYGIHLNCHSMPSQDFLYDTPFGGVMPYDFIVGSRGGTSASPAVTDHVVNELRASGWRVAVNELFSGADIVRCMGAPDANRHSLQLEINRALYLDEATGKPLPAFDELRRRMQALVGSLLEFRP